MNSFSELIIIRIHLLNYDKNLIQYKDNSLRVLTHTSMSSFFVANHRKETEFYFE